MKLETKKLIESFIEDNTYVKRVVIHDPEGSFFFPETELIDNGYFEFLIQNLLLPEEPDAQFAAMTGTSYLFVIREKNNLFICDCDTGASLSQIKMEFSMFVEDVKKQGKYKRFFKSIFGR